MCVDHAPKLVKRSRSIKSLSAEFKLTYIRMLTIKLPPITVLANEVVYVNVWAKEISAIVFGSYLGKIWVIIFDALSISTPLRLVKIVGSLKVIYTESGIWFNVN